MAVNDTDSAGINIGNMNIQNSHDVTIAGRDIHINKQNAKQPKDRNIF